MRKKNRKSMMEKKGGTGERSNKYKNKKIKQQVERKDMYKKYKL